MKDRTENQHYELNFAPQLSKIKSICSTWTNRSLSLKGKVILTRSLLSSLLQYPCSNTTTPTRVIVEYKKIITDFFWNNKRAKVAYNVLIQDIEEGGLKLPDLMTRIRTSHLYWIRYLWNNPDSFMAHVAKTSLRCDNIQHLIICKADLPTRFTK